MKRETAAMEANGALAGAAPTMYVPQELFMDLVRRALYPAPAASLLGALASRDGPVNRIVPRLGAEFHGGLYAGLTVHENDPAELILLPGEFEGPWEKAKAWAAEQGGELPTRIDQNVLFKNLKGEFKSEYYWSSEPLAGNAAYAWCQYFGYGGQSYGHKGYGCRCRAVRRISIR